MNGDYDKPSEINNFMNLFLEVKQKKCLLIMRTVTKENNLDT